MGSSLTCIKCKAPLRAGEVGPSGIPFALGESSTCPSCGAQMLVEVFPALFRPATVGSAGETLASSEEAACFYHPQKRAVVPCDSCGRFLCALCDVDLSDQHLCPNCVQTGRKKGKLRNLENERVRYDRIALTTSIAPLLFWPSTIISAPVSIFLSIRHWNSPSSIVHRHPRVRFVIAILISLAELVGWVAFFSLMFSRHR